MPAAAPDPLTEIRLGLDDLEAKVRRLTRVPDGVAMSVPRRLEVLSVATAGLDWRHA